MNVDIAVSILLVVINLEIIVLTGTLYIATDDELQQCVIFVSDGS